MDWPSTTLRRLATLWLSLVLSSCSGQPGIDDPAARAQRGQRLGYVAEFNKIDTAKSGRVTLEQATAYYTRLFGQLDTTNRGYLVADDVRPLLPMMGAESADALFSRLDNRGDGKVTLNEFLVIPNWLFQRAHGNATVLTLDDVISAANENPGEWPAARGGGTKRSGGSSSGGI